MVDSDSLEELQSSSADTIIMFLGCVGGSMGACTPTVRHFFFGGLGLGRRLFGVIGGSVVSTATYQDKEIPKNRRKIEIIIE